LINCGDQNLLDVAFQDCAGVAEQAGVFQAADTPPDDGFLPTVLACWMEQTLNAKMNSKSRRADWSFNIWSAFLN
jgi:hypothetical protein